VKAGDLHSRAALRDSKYLNREQSIEVYRWMAATGHGTALKISTKQGKVVGGSIRAGAEGVLRSAYALRKDDWMGR